MDKYYKSDIISRIPIVSGNIIANGDFNIAQRGDITTSDAVVYNLDRWKTFNTTDATFTVSQEEDAPTYVQSGYGSTYCVQVTPTVADVTLASGDYLLFSQPVEADDIQRYVIGDTSIFTLSFWLKATKTGVTCVRLIMYGTTLRILKEFTVSSSNTWEKHSWTFEAPHTTDWGGLGVNFCLGNGGPYNSPTDTWSELDYHSTSNQVNHLDNVSNIFKLSQVQLESGDSPTLFKGLSLNEELLWAQRHYCKSWDLAYDPGSSNANGKQESLVGGSSFAPVTVKWPVRMRVAPTVVLYDAAGNSGAVTTESDGNNNPASAGYIGERGFGFIGRTGGVAWTVGDWLDFHYTADASN